MNVCPICEASLSHHNREYMYHVFHWLAKEKITKTNKNFNWVIALILKLTYDQKVETFFGGPKIESFNSELGPSYNHWLGLPTENKF